MQTLYYYTASSQLIIEENQSIQAEIPEISQLIVCGSLQQIIAFSGSVAVSGFPIQNTIIYYESGSFDPGPPISSGSKPVSLTWIFDPQNIDSKIQDTYTCYITSISESISTSASFLTRTQPVSENQLYTFMVTGSDVYDASITIFDNLIEIPVPNLPGYPITFTSASNTAATLSVYLSGSGYYTAYIGITGTALP